MSRVDEIFDGRRCAVCEQPFGTDDAGVTVAGRAERMHRDAPDGCPPDGQRHFMLPGTHEWPRTPECRCGAVWYRDADACARQLATEGQR